MISAALADPEVTHIQFFAKVYRVFGDNTQNHVLHSKLFFIQTNDRDKTCFLNSKSNKPDLSLIVHRIPEFLELEKTQ